MLLKEVLFDGEYYRKLSEDGKDWGGVLEIIYSQVSQIVEE